MIKIVINFKSICMYALMHVLHAIFLIICLITYIFIIKIMFKFKCIHVFAWVRTHSFASIECYISIKYGKIALRN